MVKMVNFVICVCMLCVFAMFVIPGKKKRELGLLSRSNNMPTSIEGGS